MPKTNKTNLKNHNLDIFHIRTRKIYESLQYLYVFVNELVTVKTFRKIGLKRKTCIQSKNILFMLKKNITI